jgi:hypothetical protein
MQCQAQCLTGKWREARWQAALERLGSLGPGTVEQVEQESGMMMPEKTMD